MEHKCYVDALVLWPKSKKWRHGKACHLLVDAETPIEVLHQFAERIGMSRKWFQVSQTGVPHYDLTEKRRAVAIAKGAVEIDRQRTVEIMRAHRSKANGQQTIDAPERDASSNAASSGPAHASPMGQ